jgi:hypothetical protein
LGNYVAKYKTQILITTETKIMKNLVTWLLYATCSAVMFLPVYSQAQTEQCGFTADSVVSKVAETCCGKRTARDCLRKSAGTIRRANVILGTYLDAAPSSILALLKDPTCIKKKGEKPTNTPIPTVAPTTAPSSCSASCGQCITNCTVCTSNCALTGLSSAECTAICQAGFEQTIAGTKYCAPKGTCP